ncbi:MAG TPA: phosphotransferase [Pseudonocardiaceae bacterium]|jgi:hypothetical protein|nr:phosphotransferase [Pseudonocardiaceae bacterium]
MSAELGHGVAVWGSAAWRERAVSWLDEKLAAAGIERTGQVQQPHLRPWATALRAPTSHGPVWLKAAGPDTAFEVGLYELLHRVAPARVLPPIAVDVARGWIVLPDGGPTLKDRLTGTDLVSALERVLPQYGQLQLDLAAQAGTLLALGLTDMRAAIMPRRFEEALAVVAGYVKRHGTAADRRTCQHLAALRPTVALWCEQLGGAPAAPSLDHNDLHPGNILVAGTDGAGRARFYDWGDSVLAHPFASMLVPLSHLQRHLRAAPDDPALRRVRDAYLEVFSGLAPHVELVATLELACQVGKAARTLVWDRALRTLGRDAAGELAGMPLRCLASLLDSSYLGAR